MVAIAEIANIWPTLARITITPAATGNVMPAGPSCWVVPYEEPSILTVFPQSALLELKGNALGESNLSVVPP
jgi:hypothetical protein